MNVLVTGGAGYIGSVLTRALLTRGHRVRVLDSLLYGGESLLGVWSHPAFEFSRGDIRNPGDTRRGLKKMDAVVHLAAIVGDPACARRPELAQATNQEASLALLHESKNSGCGRFIFASTCSNYGKMKDPDRFVDETSELSPLSLYARTKVAVERAVMDQPDGELCATCLRFATVFGVSPRMRFDLTVNEFVLEMVHKKRLTVFGEQFWRPYVHVSDVARAIAAVLEAPAEQVAGEVFNVGSTRQNYQKKQLVELIRPHAPDAAVEFVHKQEDPRDYRVSFAKMEKALGCAVSRTVEDGIAETVSLVKNNIINDHENPRYKN